MTFPELYVFLYCRPTIFNPASGCHTQIKRIVLYLKIYDYSEFGRVSDVVEKKRRLVVEVESLGSSWKKITTRRREGVGVVVEKNEESRRTFNKNSCDLQSNNAHRNSVCVIQNKQFNKKTKLWKQNGRCLDAVTTAL